MKLNFPFIVIDLLTILAYPFVITHGRLRQFSKSKARIHLTNLLAPVAIIPDGYPLEKYKHAKGR